VGLDQKPRQESSFNGRKNTFFFGKKTQVNESTATPFSLCANSEGGVLYIGKGGWKHHMVKSLQKFVYQIFGGVYSPHLTLPLETLSPSMQMGVRKRGTFEYFRVETPRLRERCSVFKHQWDSLRFHWEVRECLYVYSMSKHNDLRTCEKVGKLWSLGNTSLTLKFANHSSHQEWLFQKACYVLVFD
jgi:hypothetical protein